VTLEQKTTDRYGRLVAKVFTGININLALVEDGQAFAYRQYLSDCNPREYLDAEHRASRRRYSCKEIGSYARAQELLRQGHTYLDRNTAARCSAASLSRWPLSSHPSHAPCRR
jgi:endonuclease YncB( thermonuclease family)